MIKINVLVILQSTIACSSDCKISLNLLTNLLRCATVWYVLLDNQTFWRICHSLDTNKTLVDPKKNRWPMIFKTDCTNFLEKIPRNDLIFATREAKSTIFTDVCHSVHRGACIPVYTSRHLGRMLWPGGMCGRGWMVWMRGGGGCHTPYL